jgi:hypothetical protein
MNDELDGSVVTTEQDQSSEQSQQQESQSAPSTVSFSEEQVRAAIAMSQRTAQTAMEQAEAARAEANRLRMQYEQRVAAPAFNFEELNQRASNGQFAEVQADVARQVMNEMIQPLLRESAQATRERNTIAFVDKAINSHLHPDFVRPGRDHLVTYVRGALGSAEPSEFVVKSLVDAAVGNAIAANPQMLTEFYSQQRGQSLTQTQPSNAPQSPPKPIPPRIPNGRPLVNPTNAPSTLDESEKKLMAIMGLTGKITDEEFKAGMLDPDQKFTLNINSIRNTGGAS